MSQLTSSEPIEATRDLDTLPEGQVAPTAEGVVADQSEDASAADILVTEITIASVRLAEVYGLPNRYRTNLSAVMRRRGRLLPPKPRRAGWRLAKAARKLESAGRSPVAREAALRRDLKTLNAAIDRLGTRDRLMGKPLTIAASLALLALIASAAWVIFSYSDTLRELSAPLPTPSPAGQIEVN